MKSAIKPAIKLANPLYSPLVMLVAAIVLVVGVRLVGISPWVMLPVAGILAVAAATLLQARTLQSVRLDNPALDQEVRRVQQQARALAERANGFRGEATQLLTRADQLELLATVQYACDRANELPSQIEQRMQQMQGSDSLLSIAELQQQFTQVQSQLSSSSGAARQELQQLATRLQQNIQLAQQGKDARQAQVVSLSSRIQEAAGVLQHLQNKLRSADLTNQAEAIELQSLSQEFRTVQDNVTRLVRGESQPGEL
ncbi:MAG TPA: hypothetical protein V6C65_29305 [Allocoleopsis sp.]